MESLSAIGAGKGNYYLNLGREDYYLEGGEPPGSWWQGSNLGLFGEVKGAEFRNLMAGLSPDGKERLTQEQHYTALDENGKLKREPRAAFDCCFSVPKSVSVVWAMAPPELRKEIEAALAKSVATGLKYAQEECGFARRKTSAGEIERIAGELTAALFQHGTSRAQDPQLHIHALIQNVVSCEDGKTRKLDGHLLFEHRLAMGMIQQAELAANIEKLGFQCRAEGRAFEITGVPGKLIKEFSKRREQILEATEIHGDSAKARQIAALDTREVKTHIAREKLYEMWQDVGRSMGFSTREAEALTQGRKLVRADAVHEIFESVIERLSNQESHFVKRQFLATVAELAQGKGTGALVEEAREYLESSKNIKQLGNHKDEQRYTTLKTWQLEEKLLNSIQATRSTTHHTVNATTFLAAYDKVQKQQGFELSDEQRRAVQHITMDPGSVKVVIGMAGTGKTTMLNTAREVWEQAGFKVIGCALAGKAAQGLKEGAGIESTSIAKLLKETEKEKETEEGLTKRKALAEWKYATWQINRKSADKLIMGEPKKDKPEGLTLPKLWADWKSVRHDVLAEWKYATWQIDSKTADKLRGEYFEPTSKVKHEFWYATHQISAKHRDYLNSQLDQQARREHFRIDKKTILVIDEAGMVDTMKAAKLVQEVTGKGGKVVVVGDPKQLQAIGPGGAFQAIAERVGVVRLENITRQRSEDDRKTVKQFEKGEGLSALERLAQRYLLHISNNQHHAVKKLLADWEHYGGVQNPKEHLILTARRDATQRLNLAAQDKAQLAGKLGEKNISSHGRLFYEGDRVLFTRGDGLIGVANGNLGTVKKVDRLHYSMTVTLDSGKSVHVPLYRYGEHLELGYALTTHKAQGVTVEKNAYVLCGGRGMSDLHMSYVQASRAKGETRFYTTRMECGDKLKDLAAAMSRDHQKSFAHDIAARQKEAPQQQTEWERERSREL